MRPERHARAATGRSSRGGCTRGRSRRSAGTFSQPARPQPEQAAQDRPARGRRSGCRGAHGRIAGVSPVTACAYRDRRWLRTKSDRSASSSSSRPRRRGRSRATSATTSSSSPASATSATSRQRAADIPEEYKKEKWARLGVDVENDFQPLYIVDPDKKKKVRELNEAQGRRRAPARDGRRSRGRGDRLAPARGAEAEGAGAADGLPRDHEGGDQAGARRDARRSTSGSSTRRRRAASSTASTATRSRPCSGRRSCAASRPAACSRSRRGSSSSASASGWRSAPPQWWDIDGDVRPGEPFQARLVSVDGKRVAQGRDFGPDGKLRDDDGAPARRGRCARARRRGSRTRRSPCRGGRARSRTRAGRARRS